jgi:hypothetical protein
MFKLVVCPKVYELPKPSNIYVSQFWERVLIETFGKMALTCSSYEDMHNIIWGGQCSHLKCRTWLNLWFNFGSNYTNHPPCLIMQLRWSISESKTSHNFILVIPKLLHYHVSHKKLVNVTYQILLLHNQNFIVLIVDTIQ